MKTGKELTIVLSREEVFIVHVPREDLNEISDEGRDLTFQYDAIAHDDVLFVNVSVVVLSNHWYIQKLYIIVIPYKLLESRL